MKIEPFQGDYDELAPLHSLDPDELRDRDLSRGPFERWLGKDSTGRVQAACVTYVRPDDRRFVSTLGNSDADRAQMARHARRFSNEPVHLSLDASEITYREALVRIGFEIELEMERFRVRFDRALAALSRAWLPEGFHVSSAAEVDLGRLFHADNRLRNLVPGTDGWRGDYSWFHREITEDDAFDPDSYLVAVESSSDEYVGIVRVWRNDDGPRVGFVGVEPRFRRLTLGPALLAKALTSASAWGSPTFQTETALTNRVIHPRLTRIAEESMGRIVQMRMR